MRCVRCVEIVIYRVQRTERLRCVGCVWLVTFVAFRSLRTHRLRCVACVAFGALRCFRVFGSRRYVPNGCVASVAFVPFTSFRSERNDVNARNVSHRLRWLACVRCKPFIHQPHQPVSVKDCQKKLNSRKHLCFLVFKGCFPRRPPAWLGAWLPRVAVTSRCGRGVAVAWQPRLPRFLLVNVAVPLPHRGGRGSHDRHGVADVAATPATSATCGSGDFCAN